MKSEWKTYKAEDFIEFNPRLTIRKGETATKVSMDKLQPFTKAIPEVEQTAFSGGSKFCNGDTIMARITPCLENGKTAFVDNLQDGEVAFGSTEFIVMRARPGISDPQFVYYLAISPFFRDVAIKSMVGSSGRQRVQQSVLNGLELTVPPLDVQRRIGSFLAKLDDKIELNQRINDNLQQQARMIYRQWMLENEEKYNLISLEKIAEINPDIYSPKENWDYINYLDTSNITKGTIAEIQYISAMEKIPSRARRKVAPNDIVYSTVRPNQHHYGIIAHPPKNMLVSTGFSVIRSKCPSIDNELIYLIITENESIEKMQQIAEQSTSTFPAIKPSDLGSYLIPCPMEKSGVALCRQIKSIYSVIFENNEQNRVLSSIRDNLLPKLMSGKIDVSIIKKER